MWWLKYAAAYQQTFQGVLRQLIECIYSQNAFQHVRFKGPFIVEEVDRLQYEEIVGEEGVTILSRYVISLAMVRTL